MIRIIKSYIKKNEFVRLIIKIMLSSLFCLFPIQNNKVVMDNFHGRGYGDNPKYIAEELSRRGGFKIIWLCNDLSEKFPREIQVVKRHSIRAFYESATAKAWVMNMRSGKLTKKQSKQILLQTWHGSIALKKVEKDAETVMPDNYIIKAQEDGQWADGIIVDGKSNEELFKRSFWLSSKCELLRFGTPRSDILLNEQNNVF